VEGRARGAQNDCISRLQDVAQRIVRIKTLKAWGSNIPSVANVGRLFETSTTNPIDYPLVRLDVVDTLSSVQELTANYHPTMQIAGALGLRIEQVAMTTNQLDVNEANS
jgi:hypothetical protein